MEKDWNEITFETNNGRELTFTQYRKDGFVSVSAHDGLTCDYEIDIPAGDFVMLWNLYHYIKEHDIRNDWINPNGKKEDDGTVHTGEGTRGLIESLPDNVRAELEKFRKEYKGFPDDYLRHDKIRERAAGYTQGLKDGGLLSERGRQIAFIYTTV